MCVYVYILYINIIFMITLLSLCLFYSIWNVPFVRLMQTRFNIVTTKDNLIVHFISVGQADSAVINLPDGKVMVIDTGWRTTNVTLTKYIESNIINNSLNEDIDYLIFSHADLDHSGGGRKIIKEFDVKKVFLPSFNTEKEQYLELLEDVETKCDYQIVDENIIISESDYCIEIVNSPLKDTSNNSSCIVKISYMNKSFLFTGDINSSVENLLVKEYSEFLNVDVLKVPHHGSKNGCSEEFLQVVSPEYAVISVGNNSYGHPSSEAIDKLNAVGANVLRTDIEGNIVFVVGKNYNLNPNTGDLYFTKFSLDYRVIILIINVPILFNIIFITISIFVKPKKRKKDFD